MKPFLRKVDGRLICREDGQEVTDIASHRAQWHSIGPRPSLDGMSSSSTRVDSWVSWGPYARTPIELH